MNTPENDPFAPIRPAPTSARPLLGLTILVIEDSRFACEAMRLLCLRSGARIRRADSLKSARRHLQVYRPGAAIVDLGLPDGDGTDLIRELVTGTPRPDVVMGLSGDPNGHDLAMAAGADGFLEKPIMSLAAFQEAVLTHLPADRHPKGVRVVPDETVEPDLIAFHDDIAHVADVLETRMDDKALDYIAQFLGGVARIAKDQDLANAADDLARTRADGTGTGPQLERLTGMVQDRLNNRVAI